MQDKLLDQTERALLAIIIESQARDGRVDRTALNVEARGQGLEVGRALVTLKKAGLVDEYETKPGFFARLFGGKSRTLVRALVTAVPAAPEPVHIVPAPVVAPAPVVGPEPVPEPTPTPIPEPPIPDPVVVRPPAPVQIQHFAPDDYTDKVGGGEAAGVSIEQIDPQVMEGLREMLGGMGMELTMAGETLVFDRLTKGETAGDALSQVVLFAFAHAVHYDLLSGGGMQALGLTEYAIDVMHELEKLRDAGAINAERFEVDMRTLWSLVSTEGGQVLRADCAADLLNDPIGGAAPPALLPDDIQQAEDPDDA